MQEPHDVVMHEFVSYYNADELPFVIEGGLDEQADDSGRRLVHLLGARAREAAVMLQRVIDGQDDRLLEELDRRTLYGWSGTSEDRDLLRRIVERISVAVDRELREAVPEANGGDKPFPGE